MSIARIIANLIKALADLVPPAIEAYMAGDPSKLEKVQSILPRGARLASEEMLELEREKTRQQLLDG